MGAAKLGCDKTNKAAIDGCRRNAKADGNGR